ncbi:MAG TPA: arginase [Flavobacteriales bacterium]|nr:arginase [Flavobacteriales bacterium]|tara:strand:- start:69806 stop:70966 length:1161 start_codon:yes stop_codon:yes gene_type:complete
MNIADFLTPYQKNDDTSYHPEQLGAIIQPFNDEVFIEDYDLALIGVEEDRGNPKNSGCKNAPDTIREELYKLFSPLEQELSILDLGNIKAGFQTSDTYFALQETIIQLLKKNVIPIILGGTQDLTYANFTAYQKLEQVVNLVAIDNQLNIGYLPEEELNANNYLTHIILHQPNFLFNFSNVGYQSYFVAQEEIELMNKLFFDAYRLGRVQQAMEETEPIVRNADIVSFDISAVRYSDAFANGNAVPNGLWGNEACQIARYAGLSDKVSSFGLYEYNPKLDKQNVTAQLASQIIWYFIEGFYNRKKDYPVSDISGYLKYIVHLDDGKELNFYKSDKSERWWMEVPYPEHKEIKFKRHLLIPCTYKDYQTACNNEMPDRWWKTYLKLQ